MSDVFELLHLALRYSHIVVGGLGLVLFWIPVCAKKGGQVHIVCGRVFVWTAYWVAATAIISSAWGLIDPDSFLGSRARQINEAALPAVRENFRFIFAILGYLGMVVLTGTVYGIRVVRTRRDHAQLRTPFLLSLEAAVLATTVALALFGMVTLGLSYAGRHMLPPAAASKYWIPTILGMLGVVSVREEVRYILNPRPTPMAWWYKHMEQMLGVGIGFHTAFLVFGVQRFVPIHVEGAWRLLPWVLPSLIGVPAIQLWVRSYKRRFGEVQVTGENHERHENAETGSAKNSVQRFLG